MKTLILLGLSCSLGMCCLAQTRKFYDLVAHVNMLDSLFAHDQLNVHPSGYPDPIYNWSDAFQECLKMTQKKLGSKNPFPVNERLNDLAELMVNNCSMNQLTNKKYMAKAMAMLPQNSSRYGIVIPVAFTVPVLKDNNGDFYFDSKNNSSPFHLFKGSSKNKSGHALDLFSEKDLGELLFSHLNKSSKLNKTVAGCVGVAVKVNEKTFGSSSIPSANVVILLGVSRLKLVKG